MGDCQYLSSPFPLVSPEKSENPISRKSKGKSMKRAKKEPTKIFA